MHSLVSEFQKHPHDRHNPESLLLSDLREMSDHQSRAAMRLLRRGDGRAIRSLTCVNNLVFLMLGVRGELLGKVGIHLRAPVDGDWSILAKVYICQMLMPFLDFPAMSASRKKISEKKYFCFEKLSGIVIFQVAKVPNFADSLKSNPKKHNLTGLLLHMIVTTKRLSNQLC